MELYLYRPPCVHRVDRENFTFTFFLARQPPVGHGLLIHEVSRSHTTRHHSRCDSSGRVISSSQRPLPDNTQHSQQTDIRATGGIRTHNLSKRAVADLLLRPRGHWNRLTPTLLSETVGELLLQSCKSAPIGFFTSVCLSSYRPPHVNNWELAAGKICYNFPETSDNIESNNRQLLLHFCSHLEHEESDIYLRNKYFCLTLQKELKNIFLS